MATEKTGQRWRGMLSRKYDTGFRNRVETMVSHIPRGKVMTYGQIAALCGSPLAARVVGGIAHFGDTNLNWHRVVSKNGGLAIGYPGGRITHREHLQREGIEFDKNGVKNIDNYLWRPEKIGLSNE